MPKQQTIIFGYLTKLTGIKNLLRMVKKQNRIIRDIIYCNVVFYRIILFEYNYD